MMLYYLVMGSTEPPETKEIKMKMTLRGTKGYVAHKQLFYVWTDDIKNAAVFDDTAVNQGPNGDLDDAVFVTDADSTGVSAKFSRYAELAALADDAFLRAARGQCEWPTAETRNADAVDFWERELSHVATPLMRSFRKSRVVAVLDEMMA